MKLINKVIILFVGFLFIFSGVIKINDPIGTAIKLEEYFEVFAAAWPSLAGLFHFLTGGTVFLSVLLCAAEIILGTALLVNFKRRLTVDLLLIIIIFFTFLTFYSAYFNKVTDCGCFGTVIVLTPWQSFSKDIILLVLLLILFFQRRNLTNIATLPRSVAVTIATVFSLGLATYALRHLPPVDTLPYKVGNNIPKLMKGEEPCQYTYVMTKNGTEETFTQYPTDTTYKFKEMIAVNPKKCEAVIKDYSVWNDEGEFTQETFKGNKLLIIIQNADKADRESFAVINTLVNQLKDIQVVVFTSSDKNSFETFRHEVQLAAPYYFADGVVLKTMMRSNPGLMLLSEGTVKGKWHYNDVPTIEELKVALSAGETGSASLDFD